MPFESALGASPLVLSGVVAAAARPFPGEPQQHSNWCWAAVAAGIIEQVKNRKLAQCRVASLALGGDCCSEPVNKMSSVPNVLLRDDVDVAIEWHGEDFFNDRNQAFARIKAAIDRGRAVPISVLWSGGGGGHCICAFDYATLDGAPALWIFDPAQTWIGENNRRLRPLAAMTAYPTGPQPTAVGRWIEAYLPPGV